MIDRPKVIVASRRRKLVCGMAALVGVGASALIVIPALATPGSGFTPSPVSLGRLATVDVKAAKTDKWDLFLKTKDNSDVGVDRLTVIPGGQSGWHTHAGITMITVISGEVRITDGLNCSARSHRAGDSFIEPANRPHIVRNLSSSVTAELTAVQIRPAGTRPRIDAPAPEDCNL